MTVDREIRFTVLVPIIFPGSDTLRQPNAPDLCDSARRSGAFFSSSAGSCLQAHPPSIRHRCSAKCSCSRLVGAER